MLNGIRKTLSTIFSGHARKAIGGGALGAQIGLDIGAALILTGLAVAAAPLTLAFTAVAGAVTGGFVGYRHAKQAAGPSPR